MSISKKMSDPEKDLFDIYTFKKENLVLVW